MAHINHWHPHMTDDERAWYDACPKSVLFEMARQLAALAIGEEDVDKAFVRMQEEWAALHSNDICPQKPFNVAKERTKREAFRAKHAAFRTAHPNGVRIGDLIGRRSI
jgi:hypothetical protein